MYRFKVLESNILDDASLSIDESDYWYNFALRNVKLGIELELNVVGNNKHWPPRKVNAYIRQNFTTEDSQKQANINYTCCRNADYCKVSRDYRLCRTYDDPAHRHACPIRQGKDLSSCRTCSLWTLKCPCDCQSFSPLKSRDRTNINHSPSASAARTILSKVLDPSGRVDLSGKCGIYSIVSDGSLRPEGGAEIIIAGTAPVWGSIKSKVGLSIEAASRVNAFTDEYCGVHFHVILEAYKEEDTNYIPPVILLNYFSLLQAFETPMAWMSSALPRPYITRWARFRRRLGTLPYDIPTESMPVFKQASMLKNISHEDDTKKANKYLSSNFLHSRFSRNAVSKIHIENRIPDGNMSPTSVAALSFVPVALLLKAITLSQHGVIKSIRDPSVDQCSDVLFCSEDAEYTIEPGARLNCITEPTLRRMMPTLIERSKEMISFIEREITDLGGNVDVLFSLAENPISMRLKKTDDIPRITADEWREIEHRLVAVHA